jgi:hypothetical protein
MIILEINNKQLCGILDYQYTGKEIILVLYLYNPESKNTTI